jgi:hypothetical protein
MNQDVIRSVETQILRDWYGRPNRHNQEMELLFWDGFSYNQANRCLKVVGNVEVITQILNKFGKIYEECEWNIVERKEQ